MKLPFKRQDPSIETPLPVYAKPGDSGMDLYATSISYDEKGDFIEYGTNLRVAIPIGYEGQLRMRSSVSKVPITLCNGLGTIDSGYRGEIKARFRAIPSGLDIADLVVRDLTMTETCYHDALNAAKLEQKSEFAYTVGEAVAQLVIVPVVLAEPFFAPDLGSTERGEGSFGSTTQP